MTLPKVNILYKEYKNSHTKILLTRVILNSQMCSILKSNYIRGINRGTRYKNYLSLRDYTKMDLEKKNTVWF